MASHCVCIYFFLCNWKPYALTCERYSLLLSVPSLSDHQVINLLGLCRMAHTFCPIILSIATLARAWWHHQSAALLPCLSILGHCIALCNAIPFISTYQEFFEDFFQGRFPSKFPSTTNFFISLCLMSTVAKICPIKLLEVSDFYP